MEIWQAIILGIVQGVTEFLPISSTGHLVVMQRVFGMEEPKLTFDVIVHVGSLVSIFVFFWKDIWALVKNPFCKFTGLLMVASLPVVIAGFALQDVIATDMRASWIVAGSFVITGFLLLIADYFIARLGESRPAKTDADITYLDALIIGVMQAFALMPAISRSGVTLTGALGRGLDRKAATRFVFFMAIITIAGAGALEAIGLIRDPGAVEAIGFAPLAVGFVLSAVVGYASIGLLLRLISSAKLRYFSYYVWGLAALIFVDMIFFNRFF